MGFRFRKSIKILPGIKVNLTEKGISSASIGKRGANINIGKKGTRTTMGLPGSGLSYSKYKAYEDNVPSPQEQLEQPNPSSGYSPHHPPQQSVSSAKFSTGSVIVMLLVAFVLGAIIF